MHITIIVNVMQIKPTLCDCWRSRGYRTIGTQYWLMWILFLTMPTWHNWSYIVQVCVFLLDFISVQLVLIAFWTFNMVLPCFVGTLLPTPTHLACTFAIFACVSALFGTDMIVHVGLLMNILWVCNWWYITQVCVFLLDIIYIQ